MEWYEKFPKRWQQEQEIGTVLKNYFSGILADGRAYIHGEMFISTNDNSKPLGPFELAIVYPRTFPKEYVGPDVFLMNNPYKWKNDARSHIETHWRLCLGVAIEGGIDFRKPDSLHKLLQKTSVFIMLQFEFQFALLRESIGGPRAKWPTDDRLHGAPGVAQAAPGWTLKTHGHQYCPCGKGQLYRRCCGPVIEKERTRHAC